MMKSLVTCAPIEDKSACSSARYVQNLRCPHEHALRPWLSKKRSGKILIRLCECECADVNLYWEHMT